MPRLSDQYLDCVVYLYRSEHEATEGIRIGGSGFLVSVEAVPAIGGGRFVYVVTNRHVIQGGAVFMRSNLSDGMAVSHLPAGGWIFAPEDDLAICGPLRAAGDSTPLEKSIGLPSIISKEIAEQIKLGIGDEVFMVGRFISHEGVQKNSPLVRFGHISQMPSEPIRYNIGDEAHDQLSIIADIRSIGGYSGSPVFLNETNLFQRTDSTMQIDRKWLIGIDWGHIPLWHPVCGTDEKPVGITQVNVNSGMAGIVPAWKLLDLLMSDKVKNRRDAVEALYSSAKESPAGSPDFSSGESSPPASDANPTHREDFMRLVGAAARKPPPAG